MLLTIYYNIEIISNKILTNYITFIIVLNRFNVVT